MQVSELRVSLPLPPTHHQCAELACLRRHLVGESLPAGWIQLADSTTEGNLVFAKVAVSLPLLAANTSMLLKVDHQLKWSLSCHGIRIEVGQRQFLAAIPSQLTSVTAVLDLIATLQEVAVCAGNPVDDFKQLVDAGIYGLHEKCTLSDNDFHCNCIMYIRKSTSGKCGHNKQIHQACCL